MISVRTNLLRRMAAARTSATAASVMMKQQQRFFSVGGEMIRALKNENPHVEAVQYEHKTQKFTVAHVDYFSEAIAVGLVENGLIPGDVVLHWLPQHFAETMMLQFACSKAGLILYSLDPMLATKSLSMAEDQLKAALELTKANVFISQEAGDDTNYVRIAEHVIPELELFDYATGMPFMTPRFPHLRLCIQTGFDQDEKEGWLTYKSMIVPANNLNTHIDVSKINDQTPLAGELIVDDKGIPVKLGKTLTNAEVLQKKLWPTYCKIVSGEWHLVEGVGVVW